MSSEKNPEKKPTFKRAIIVGALIGLGVTNLYKAFHDFDRASPRVTPEQKLAEAADSNPEVRAAMGNSLVRVLVALQSDHEAICKDSLDGPTLSEASKKDLPVDQIVSRLIELDAKRSGKLLKAEFEKEARLVEEARALGADIGDFSNILALGMTKKMFDAAPSDYSSRAQDGLMEIRALGEEAFSLGEIRGCAIDMRLIDVSKEMILKTASAYTKMRNLAYASKAPVGEKEDLFLNLPEASRPELAPGVIRFRTEGPFTLIVELSENQASTCDAINAAVAEPLPEWAMGGGAPPPDLKRRWSCVKHEADGSSTGVVSYVVRYNAFAEGALVQGRR